MTERNGNDKKNVFQQAVLLLYPRRCAVCGALLTHGESELCADCTRQCRLDEMRCCPRCLMEQAQCRCAPMDMPRRGPECYAHLLPYPSKTANGIISKLKKKHANAQIDFCAERLSRLLRKIAEEKHFSAQNTVVSYIPRSPGNVNAYGYDHASIVSARIARSCALPFSRLLYQSGGGAEQKNLRSAQRRENALAHFHLRRGAQDAVKGKNVVLVDDVITSGASMYACCCHLRAAGALQIVALTLAKTEYHYTE